MTVYNLIPEFLWIGPLMVALVLRPAVALAFLLLAVQTLRVPEPGTRTTWHILVAGMYLLFALLFALGLFVQHAALLGIVAQSSLLALHRWFPLLYRSSPEFYVLLYAALLSLLLTGAGPLSLDSPL